MNDIETEIVRLQQQLSKLTVPPSLRMVGMVILGLLVTIVVGSRFNLVVSMVASVLGLLLYLLLFAYQERRMDRIRERRVVTALLAYRQALRELSREPENLDLEGQAVYAGRRYLRECRNEGQNPVIDEPQIRTEIASARGHRRLPGASHERGSDSTD